MHFTFENQGTNTYLVYEIGADDELDTMSLGMLTNNSIPGFAAASFTQMDMTKYIKFNVSSKVSAAQLFSGAVNKKRLVGVLSGIVDAMLAAEDYMLEPNSLLLDLDYIFADVSTCETVVVCLPVMNCENKNPELGMFFKNIIFNTQFDQTENCDHVAQILNYLNSNTVLNLQEFKELLENIGKLNEPAPQPVQPAPPVLPAEQPQPTQPKVPQAKPAHVAVPASNVTSSPAVKTAGKQLPVQTPPKHSDLQFGANYDPANRPAASAKINKNNLPQAPQVQAEKPMSMFYLLQHYNKENAAIYKAQQEAKKAQKAGAPAPRSTPQKAPSKPVNPGFAVPGQPNATNPSFAVPNRQPAAPASKVPQATPAYTVPNQQPAAPVQKPVQQIPQPVQTAIQNQQAVPVSQQYAQVGTSISFGETTVLSTPNGETTVLAAPADPNKMDPHLIRAKNNEKIPLNKPVFRIGKERSYVDYFISDNTAISRSHANIVNHNGEFFVVDTNSTNHTYVNGGMIHSNVETKLSHGTKIRLANEDFEFRMY